MLQFPETNDKEVVLTRTLREKLVLLNPDLPNEAYDDAVRQIVATEASGTITLINREKYDLLRDGVPVAFSDSNGQRTKERLRVYDYSDYMQNDF